MNSYDAFQAISFDAFQAIRAQFIAVWPGDPAEVESEAASFVDQLRSLATENHPHTRKPSKERDLAVQQFRSAITKAAQYAARLDRIDWFSLAHGDARKSQELKRKADELRHFAVEIDTAEEERLDVQRESRKMTIANGLMHIFAIFNLPASDSDSSLAAWCLGAVFEAARIEATSEAVRHHVRRAAKRLQK